MRRLHACRGVPALALLTLALLAAAPAQAQHVRTLSVEALAPAAPGALALTGHAALVPEATSGAFRVYGTARFLAAPSSGTPVEVAPTSAPESNAGPALPAAFALGAAYPNPLSDRAAIPYALPEDASVSLVVYDVLGREVARLVEADLAAGWHEAALDAGSLAAGTYVYRFEATGAEGPFVQTGRLTVIR